MIDLTTFPVITQSKGAFELSFVKKGIVNSAGTYAQVVYRIDTATAPATGQLWKLQWNGKTITLNFSGRDGIDANKMDFYTGPTIEGFCTSLIKDLQRHHVISADFEITLLPTDNNTSCYILFKAKEIGANYNLTIGSGTTITITAALTVAGNNASPVNDYKLKLKIKTLPKFIDDRQESEYTFEGTGVPDYDRDQINITFYDVVEYCRNLMSASPPLLHNVALFAPERTIEFTFEVWEEYNNGANYCQSKILSLTDFNEEISPWISVLFGGTPLRLGIDTLNPLVSETGVYKFLTNCRRTKLTDATGPEWLSLLITGPGSYTVRFGISYSDNSTATYDRTFTFKESGVYDIPAGVSMNGLQLVNIFKTIVKYTVKVIGSGTDYSETFTFIIDNRHFQNKKFFVFVNGVGGIDVLRCVGESEFSTTYNRTISEYARTVDSEVSQGLMEMSWNSAMEKATINTGWILNKQDLTWLQDLMLSNYVWEMIMPFAAPDEDFSYKQKFEAVRIITDRVEWLKDNDFTWGLKFDIERAWSDVSYSNLVLPNDVYVDNVYEFTVKVTDLLSSSSSLSIVCYGDYYIGLWNGAFYLPGFTAIPIDKTGVYKFVLVGKNISTIILEAYDIQAELTPGKFVTQSLTHLELTGWNSMNNNVLIHRMKTLKWLETFIIGKGNADLLLAAALDNWLKFGNLRTVDVSQSVALTAVGIAAKDRMVNDGLTVTV